MGWWSDRVVPRLTERSLAAPQIEQLRRRACAPLRGSIVELGFGSGLNLPHLPSAVTSVHAVEPNDVAWERSEHRRNSSVTVARSGLDGERLDENDNSLGACLTTFTLCTIPDVHQALQEALRVVTPGGKLCFLEHGQHPDPGVRRWQRRLDPWQQRLFGGCHLHRDIPALVRAAGWYVEELEQHDLFGGVSRPWSYISIGWATKPVVEVTETTGQDGTGDQTPQP